ncbi:hypothetical protein AAMO2058_000836000 [Amorphochlora amoebiformis]
MAPLVVGKRRSCAWLLACSSMVALIFITHERKISAPARSSGVKTRFSSPKTMIGARCVRIAADRRNPYETSAPKVSSESSSAGQRSPYADVEKRPAPPKKSPFDSYTDPKVSPFDKALRSGSKDVLQTTGYEAKPTQRDPEGFWENVARYIRYFFSVNFGIIFSILINILTAVFKNPWVILVIGGSGAGVWFTLKAMLDVQ